MLDSRSVRNAEFEQFCRSYIDGTQFKGYDFLFSPDSYSLAVWNDQQIEIYDLTDSLRGAIEDNRIHQVTSIPVKQTDAIMPNSDSAVWSPESRWLAYSDGAGLWIWDVFTQPPHLYLEAVNNHAPRAHRFSNSGRYLTIDNGSQITIHDLDSDLIFPDGVIRDDEKALLRMDTIHQMPVRPEMCSLLDGQCEFLFPDEPDKRTVSAEWVEHEISRPRWDYKVKTCQYESGECLFRYERYNNWVTAVLLPPFKIGFTHYPSPMLDLEGYIEAPIQAVYWLPVPSDTE